MCLFISEDSKLPKKVTSWNSLQMAADYLRENQTRKIISLFSLKNMNEKINSPCGIYNKLIYHVRYFNLTQTISINILQDISLKPVWLCGRVTTYSYVTTKNKFNANNHEKSI